MSAKPVAESADSTRKQELEAALERARRHASGREVPWGMASTAGGLVIAGVGWLDVATGTDIGLSLFYLLPVALAAWLSGRLAGLILAVAAAAVWTWADLTLRVSDHLEVSLWNGTTRLAMYAAIAALIATVRDEQRQLRALAQSLDEMLERETRLARTDALTGLPNERAFRESLRIELARARRIGHTFALAFLDLDNFKRINDLYGHAAGDEVLKNVATVLRASIRGGDLVARIGGDELVVLFAGTEHEEARQICARFLAGVALIADMYPDAGLGLSVGLVPCDAEAEDADAILARGDAAMYRSKRARKAQVPRA